MFSKECCCRLRTLGKSEKHLHKTMLNQPQAMQKNFETKHSNTSEEQLLSPLIMVVNGKAKK